MKCFFKFLKTSFQLTGLSILAALSTLPAQDAETSYEQFAILLDISAEMGHLVPQARKEIKHLNKQLEQANRPPVKVVEIDGARLDTVDGLAVPARKNALVQLSKLCEDEAITAIYWVTHMRGFQSGDGFHALEGLFAKESNSKKLIIKHTWPAEIRAGRSWVDERGDPNEDPLHPKSFPKEWLEPVLKSKGRVIRMWREAPPLYSALNSPLKIPFWKEELYSRFGVHFAKKREYPQHITGVGKQVIENRTLIPFLDEKKRDAQDTLLFDELKKRPSLEEDLKQIETKRIGVLFAVGYLQRDLSILKNSISSNRHDETEGLKAIQKLSKEFREHSTENSGKLDRVYDTFVFEADPNANREALKKQNESIARRAASMIHQYDLDALYLITNGFTSGRDYGKFPMSLQPLATFMKEKKTRLYVRVPFEMGVAPYELQQLAVATGGKFLVGPGEEIDPDFKTGSIEAKWPPSE